MATIWLATSTQWSTYSVPDQVSASGLSLAEEIREHSFSILVLAREPAPR